MKVVVYDEGVSDKLALESLLRPLLMTKRNEGVAIDFFEAPPGDKKKSVMEKVPVRAANILLNDPQSVVVALPDLYPMNKGFPHVSAQELAEGVHRNFAHALKLKGVTDTRVAARFHVFCLKHDLEVLLLAAEEALGSHLDVQHLVRSWVVPVEDQNHTNPPKVVVEELFHRHGRRYIETSDAPMILASVTYKDIAARCPQCFAPFVEFIESL